MLLYVILFAIIIFCYVIFKAVHNLELFIENKLEEKHEEANQCIKEKSDTLSNQLFEINHKIDFYLNNTSLVEKFGFDDALKNYLQTKFTGEGYSAEQAQFKALLVTEEMQFNTIVLDFLSKKKKYSHFDLEQEFETILGEVELKKEFLYENKLQQNTYCFIKQIIQNKEKFNKKGIVLFTTFPPIDIFGGTYCNHYHRFLEKFFLLNYLMKQNLIQKVDYKEQERLKIYCLASEYCFKINDTEASKFLEKNKQLESNCNSEDIDWFNYNSV